MLHSGVRGVTDLMVMPGLINLDFADIRTVMAEMGKAMMGTGEAEGEDRAIEAAEKAISNPLLDDVSMSGARGVLINITGGYDMTLFEVDEAANRIREEVDADANIIFGSTFDDDLDGRIRVSVVATGIDAQPQHAAAPAQKPEALTLVPSGRPAGLAPARPAVAAAPAPQSGPHPGTPPGSAQRRAVNIPGSFLRPAVNTAAMPEPHSLGPVPVVLEEQEAASGLMTPAPAPNSCPRRPSRAGGRPGGIAPAAQQAATGGAFRNLFRSVTGGGLMRRSLPEPTPAPVASQLVSDNPAPRPATRAPQQDDMGLDIPTFLRRQSN